MRTEREVMDRIYELEEMMKIAITRYYRKDDNEETFKRIYSDVWSEMKTLHWILGKSSIEATTCVASKVVRIVDEVKAKLNS